MQLNHLKYVSCKWRNWGKVMMDLCQRVFDGKEMPDEWKTSVIVPIFKGKGDVQCSLQDFSQYVTAGASAKLPANVQKLPDKLWRTLLNKPLHQPK